jgi:hypothetical protein
MKSIIFICLFFLFSPIHIFSQEIIINGKPGNRPLIWSDFAGKQDKESTKDAYTYWNITYGHQGAVFKGDTVVFKELKVKLELNSRESWRKKEKESPELLKHEQGHFDIGRLFATELQQAFATEVFLRKDSQPRLQKIFSEALKKYTDLGLKYDKETDHSKNKPEQQKWNLLFETQLQN